MPPYYLSTGQTTCHNDHGRQLPCQGSGQDAEFRKGIPWPKPRFIPEDETVLDILTGLVWTRNANPAEFPMTWPEALEFVRYMNKKHAYGYSDWRMPNRRELRSLISHQTKKPALPQGHPFKNVFLGWYWTSTTAAINTAYAWYVHMEGARMFYGAKIQSYLLWPVRGNGNGILPNTGQKACYDENGIEVACRDSGQDPEFRFGHSWPEPRFFEHGSDCIIDQLTGLCWLKIADLTNEPVSWGEALAIVAHLNKDSATSNTWRLPNINELESLVDCSSHNPALPIGHPFTEIKEAYWSSTTSMFEPDWAWVLYLHKGAVGVGYKQGPHFHVWPVRDHKIYGTRVNN